jgi:uncharacterized membrane protein YgcG
VVITIESLKGEDVSQLALAGLKLGNWSSKEDNGVIILVARKKNSD